MPDFHLEIEKNKGREATRGIGRTGTFSVVHKIQAQRMKDSWKKKSNRGPTPRPSSRLVPEKEKCGAIDSASQFDSQFDFETRPVCDR